MGERTYGRQTAARCAPRTRRRPGAQPEAGLGVTVGSSTVRAETANDRVRRRAAAPSHSPVARPPLRLRPTPSRSTRSHLRRTARPTGARRRATPPARSAGAAAPCTPVPSGRRRRRPLVERRQRDALGRRPAPEGTHSIGDRALADRRRFVECDLVRPVPDADRLDHSHALPTSRSDGAVRRAPPPRRQGVSASTVPPWGVSCRPSSSSFRDTSPTRKET